WIGWATVGCNKGRLGETIDFFFSSRRRHTRSYGDWSSDVCSSDLQGIQEGPSLQMDRSGALLYAVNGAGVDIIDARTGQLRERVLLTEPILGGPTEVVPTTPSKVIAITPTGDQIFLLTRSGLTVVDLDSVPLGIGSVTPASGPAGTVVTVRGTGFVTGTSLNVNGTPASASLVDSSTLSVTIPTGVQKGAAQITLKTPDNSQFTLDAAFLVQCSTAILG